MAKPISWNEVKQRVQAPDGLPLYKVKPHTAAKLFFWHQYVQTVAQAMIGKPEWSGGVSYLDLYSGPGICQVEATGERLPGSPLIAAMTRKPLSAIACCDQSAENARACRARLKKLGANALVISGDANDRVTKLLQFLPPNSLTLTFLDRYAFNLVFRTIATIAKGCRADLLILFADWVDLVRNIENRYSDPQSTRIDDFLGAGSDWRERYAALSNSSGENVARLFRGLFRDQLETQLGYKHFREQPIGYGDRNYYTLMFASRHERGADLWDKISSRDPFGQDSLF